MGAVLVRARLHRPLLRFGPEAEQDKSRSGKTEGARGRGQGTGRLLADTTAGIRVGCEAHSGSHILWPYAAHRRRGKRLAGLRFGGVCLILACRRVEFWVWVSQLERSVLSSAPVGRDTPG